MAYTSGRIHILSDLYNLQSCFMKNATKKMRELYDQWQTQGISKQAFCNSNGIEYHQFYYWIKKFRRNDVTTVMPIRGFSQKSVQQPDVIEQNQQLCILHYNQRSCCRTLTKTTPFSSKTACFFVTSGIGEYLL
jgi:hypothetical protein